MKCKRPQPLQPDRIRAISGSFSWIDHRFFRQGFDQGLTRLEKLLYLVLVAVSNRDGVSFYSDERLGEFLEPRADQREGVRVGFGGEAARLKHAVGGTFERSQGAQGAGSLHPGARHFRPLPRSAGRLLPEHGLCPEAQVGG